MHAHVHTHASCPREIIIFPRGSPLPANLQHWIGVRAAEGKGCCLLPLLSWALTEVWVVSDGQDRKGGGGNPLFTLIAPKAESFQQVNEGCTVLGKAARQQTCPPHTHYLLFHMSVLRPMATSPQTFSLRLVWTKRRNGMKRRTKEVQGG